MSSSARVDARPGPAVPASPVQAAIASRRSFSKVTDEAPTHDELVELLEIAGRVADHSSLRPWRVIEIRGDARDRVGTSFAVATGADEERTASLIGKTRRAPLLLAIVASHRPSEKVPGWEQDAVAAGVAHALSLLLTDAGWGVIWRTGHYTRDTAVAEAHRLTRGEHLLGWLYVGGMPVDATDKPRKPIGAARFLTSL